MLTPRQAYRIASQWGSYMYAGDPGACFYSFHLNDGRPVSEEHRAACLAYLDERRGVLNTVRDKRQLRQLRDFLQESPLYMPKARAA